MSNFNCGCKRDCTTLALMVSIAIGIVVAFLRITGVVLLGTAALITAFGIAVVFLAVTLAVAVRLRTEDNAQCLCPCADRGRMPGKMPHRLHGIKRRGPLLYRSGP